MSFSLKLPNETKLSVGCRFEITITVCLHITYTVVGPLFLDGYIMSEVCLTPSLFSGLALLAMESVVCLQTTHSSYEYYNDVMMGTIASQITSLTIVFSTVYSDADQRRHQSSASLSFVRGIHRVRWIPRTYGQWRGKCFNLMTSSWRW